MRKRTLKTCASVLLLAYPVCLAVAWFVAATTVNSSHADAVREFMRYIPFLDDYTSLITWTAFGACAGAWLLSGSMLIDGGRGWLRWVNVGLWLTAWVLGAWYAFTLM